MIRRISMDVCLLPLLGDCFITLVFKPSSRYASKRDPEKSLNSTAWTPVSFRSWMNWSRTFAGVTTKMIKKAVVTQYLEKGGRGIFRKEQAMVVPDGLPGCVIKSLRLPFPKGEIIQFRKLASGSSRLNV
jgi:hypothetical protein